MSPNSRLSSSMARLALIPRSTILSSIAGSRNWKNDSRTEARHARAGALEHQQLPLRSHVTGQQPALFTDRAQPETPQSVADPHIHEIAAHQSLVVRW